MFKLFPQAIHTSYIKTQHALQSVCLKEDKPPQAIRNENMLTCLARQ